jgi:hypothetical protein
MPVTEHFLGEFVCTNRAQLRKGSSDLPSRETTKYVTVRAFFYGLYLLIALGLIVTVAPANAKLSPQISHRPHSSTN